MLGNIVKEIVFDNKMKLNIDTKKKIKNAIIMERHVVLSRNSRKKP